MSIVYFNMRYVKILVTAFLAFLSLFLNAQEVIKNAGPIVLPAPPEISKVIASGQSLKVVSNRSITLGAGFHAQKGSVVIVKIETGNTYPQAPLVSNANPELNWVLSRNFDVNGDTIAESKSFFDLSGHPLQSQFKSFTTRHVLGTQPIYDRFGRPAIQTLAAPINSSDFYYKSDFVKNASGERYNTTNFDTDNKLNVPDPVNSGQMGTLGWYYSNNNSWDNYIPVTAYPYSRADFMKDGSDEQGKSAGVGEQLNMGSGHETYGSNFGVQNQLNHYLSIRNKFFNTPDMGVIGQTDMSGAAIESIGRDSQGKWGITIRDKDGIPLMSALAGNWLTINNTIELNDYKDFFTLNAKNGNSTLTGIKVNGFGKLKVYDNNTLVYSGDANAYIPPEVLDATHAYVLKSNKSFNVSYNTKKGVDVDPTCINCSSKVNTLSSLVGQDFHYFGLTQPGSLSVENGTISLKNLITNEPVTNYSNLSSGLYKAVAISGSPRISYATGYSDISYNFYDLKGNLVASIAPSGVQQLISNGINSYTSKEQLPFTDFFDYDKQGRLLSVKQTDEGLKELVYRKDGRIRFSQNAEQKKKGKFSYVNYDQTGRIVESGEFSSATIGFADVKANYDLIENTNADGGLIGGTKTDWSRMHYDLIDNAHGLSNYEQDFVENNVSWTENANYKTWYSYDEQGRVVWIIKQLAGLGTKTIDYSYDFLGNLITVAYQKDVSSERFYHHYEYDLDQRLAKVQTSLDGILKKQQAKYDYFLHGPLKRIELGDKLQGIDYTYTAQGLLKAINHPLKELDPGRDGIQNGFGADVFGMTLEYFNGDYTRSNTGINSLITNTNKAYYDGNIVGQSWGSKKPNSVTAVYGNGVNNPAMVTYEYDDKYQFNNNKFGTPNFTSNSFTEQLSVSKEHNVTYDANGNIQTMSRNNASGVMKALNYHYQANTNKLSSVDNHASYQYDDLGQMKAQSRANGQGFYLDYNLEGKVSAMYSDEARTQLRLSYSYDEAGFLVKKTDHVANIETFYLTDATGGILAIYDNVGGVLKQKEIPVYAESRIGYYRRLTNTYQYELNDHLGNVRVVINGNKLSNGEVDVVSYADYYPYGTTLTLQSGADYRNGFQGQYAEADNVTGWNNFELRMYDPEIGRWMSTDPAGQHYSPYVGMGNTPVLNVDPDGGEDGKPDPPARTLKEVVIIGGKGFMAGINSTIDMIKSQFTWKGYREGLLNTFTLGAYGAAKTTEGIYDLINNIPSYTRNDYIYGTGFLLEKGAEILVFKKASGALRGALATKTEAGLVGEFQRVRHHTSRAALKGIKNSNSIHASRGVPYGVDVEVGPFLNPMKVEVGQFVKGAYVEFSVPKGTLPHPPGYMGGAGNVGRIITGGAPFDLTGTAPKFVRWPLLGF